MKQHLRFLPHTSPFSFHKTLPYGQRYGLVPTEARVARLLQQQARPGPMSFMGSAPDNSCRFEFANCRIELDLDFCDLRVALAHIRQLIEERITATLVADALRSPADVFDGGTTLALDDARAHVPQGCGGPGLPGFGLTDDERARVLRWGPGAEAAEAEDSIGFLSPALW
jgi:hypothetical protein